MLAFKMLCTGAFNKIRKALYDKTVLGPVTVVNAGYITVSQGGRLSVKLQNGWLVNILCSNDAVNQLKLLVSKDNGASWADLCYAGITSVNLVNPTIVAEGNVVYFTGRTGTGLMYSYRVDVTTQTNTNVAAYGTIVGTNVTSWGNGSSLVLMPNGDLVASWIDKIPAYPNSFNVRMSRSTNKGQTWSAPFSVTTTNNSVVQYSDLSMACNALGDFVIAVKITDNTSKTINVFRNINGTWSGNVYVTPYPYAYDQGNPCIDFAPDGTLGLVWVRSTTNSNPLVFNVYMATSTDVGATWSALSQLTTETTHAYNQSNPSLAFDANNKAHIGFAGYTAAIGGAILLKYLTNKTGSWVVRNLSVQTSGVNAEGVHLCNNYRDFDFPLMVYKDVAASKVLFQGAWYVGDIRYDRTRGVVVDAAYGISGNGGRKIVRLSNGWWVKVMSTGASSVRWYVSKDRRATWDLQATLATSVGQYLAIASFGTKVYTLVGLVSTVNNVFFYSFDALTTPLNYTVPTFTGAPETAQTAMGDCSLTVEPNGDLHATWSSKNGPLPNSFNIRHSKSIDGGVTWSAPTQITTNNNASVNHTSPCIVIRADGKPTILWAQDYPSYKKIKAINFTTVWGSEVSVSPDGDYGQYNPCATVDSNGVIKLVWTGYDATDPSKVNIRYSESSDGVTWSAMLKLTTGNTASQSQPTITCDLNNDVHVIWTGGVGGDTNYAIRYIKRTSTVWGSIQNLTAATSPIPEYPQICDNHKDFIEPAVMWLDRLAGNIKCRGKWYEESEAA